jgi:ribosome-binding protein aMBF1 (putative translation factor)
LESLTGIAIIARCGPWSIDLAVAHGQHQEVPPRAVLHPALKKLGERVRQLRQARNWSQEDLAGECGIDRSYVSGLEVGRRNPTYLVLLKLSKALEVSAHTLLDIRK